MSLDDGKCSWCGKYDKRLKNSLALRACDECLGKLESVQKVLDSLPEENFYICPLCSSLYFHGGFCLRDGSPLAKMQQKPRKYLDQLSNLGIITEGGHKKGSEIVCPECGRIEYANVDQDGVIKCSFCLMNETFKTEKEEKESGKRGLIARIRTPRNADENVECVSAEFVGTSEEGSTVDQGWVQDILPQPVIGGVAFEPEHKTN